MAKQYVKTGTSLVPVSEDKIRNYESLDCVRAAIQRGELTENDLFTTVCNVQAICDDLAHELYRVISYIPANTNSTDNKLVNQCGAVSKAQINAMFTLEGTTLTITPLE